MASSSTLYEIAHGQMRRCTDVYLKLTAQSTGLTALCPEHLADERARLIVMAGFGIPPQPMTAQEVCAELQHRQAVPFDLETGITAGVYSTLRTVSETFYEELRNATNGFKQFDALYLAENPRFLPLLQHLGGIFSKAKLKQLIGSVSDKRISKPAAERLSKLLSARVAPSHIVKGEILKRLEATLEGIVRDLVGRILLESIVETALRKRGLPFLREGQYKSLPGVIYDFRADFVLPDEVTPKAFIEVRKSSSRHASLYAKDKMFSAINWKGKTTDLLAVLVTDGDWTRQTLSVMANVFDYVVPIGRIDELVQCIEAYLDGDRSRLKWFIDFRIRPAAKGS